MNIVPLQALQHQREQIRLAGQSCTIEVYQKGDYLYLDLALPSNQVITGMVCLNRVRLIRQSYLGFSGQLAFVDLQGSTDPQWQGLGTVNPRYVLVYYAPEDL